jgi:hypothetical protein
MSKDRIEVGDIVSVWFTDLGNEPNCEHEMEVLYIPQATGDSWVLRRKNGQLVYVQMFAKMVEWRIE